MRAMRLLVAVAAAMLGGSSAHADAPPSVIVWVEGPHADVARAEILRSLGGDASASDPAAWRAAFVHENAREPSVSKLEKPSSRAAVLERVRRATTWTSVDEVIIVITSRVHGRDLASAYLIGKEGEPEVIDRVAFGESGAPLGTAVHERLTSLRKPPPEVVATPPVPTPPPDVVLVTAPPSPVRDAIRARPHHVVGGELFDVAIGVDISGRQFSSGVSGVRDYWLGAAPLLVVDGAVYPLADVRVPILSDIGVVGGYARAVGLSSQSAVTSSVGTQWQRWYAGGRLRIRTGGANAPVLGLLGAYGSEAFTFASASDVSGTYPSVEYDYVRLRGDARIPIGPIAVTATCGYLLIVSSAGVPPNTSVEGIEATLSGSVELAAGFEARLGGSYRRFFVGPSLDEFWGITAAIAYVY